MSETKEQLSGFEAAEIRSEPMARAGRVRDAIRRGGGNKVVATRSGVSLTTLQNYLNGQPMKLDAALALANACNVTVEWLATGKTAEPTPAPAPSAPASPPKLFSVVDMDLLGAVITKAISVLAAQGVNPEGRAFAQIICILYDEAKQRYDAENSTK